MRSGEAVIDYKIKNQEDKLFMMKDLLWRECVNKYINKYESTNKCKLKFILHKVADLFDRYEKKPNFDNYLLGCYELYPLIVLHNKIKLKKKNKKIKKYMGRK